MTVTFRPARREGVKLMIGLAGSSGSGKTFSALTLATGIAAGQRFAVIDTENGRASHYADRFQFDVADLRPPFTPARYMEAITAATTYPVIVIDSASHEHAGEGGLLDMAETDLDRRAGDDYKRREKLTMSAWIKPKREHQKMLNQLLQLDAHVIFCFRAAEKVEMVKDDKGRTIIQPMQKSTGKDGWVPIAEKNLPYEMTVSMLLTADRPGVPRIIKIEDDIEPLISLDQPITTEVGSRLAEWAAGTTSPADPVDDPAYDALVNELMCVATLLGKQTETTAAINRHRGDKVWLANQVTNARITALAQGIEVDAAVDQEPAAQIPSSPTGAQ